MVVFFDIDGTVVDNDTQIIPESTVEALRLLRENGHISVVNTGRPYGHIDPRIRALAFDGWICACGMEVILNGQYLHRDYPSKEICHRIAEAAHRYGLLIQAESENELFYDETMTYSGFSAREAVRLAAKGIKVVPFSAVPDFSFVKFVTHDIEGSDRAAFLAVADAEFDYFIHEGTMIEYAKRGNTKAKGMERLLQALDIPKEQTFAIGDSGNDLPMFAMAGTTICMGNGMDVLKAQADYVTDSVVEGGIYKALKHYGLI